MSLNQYQRKRVFILKELNKKQIGDFLVEATEIKQLFVTSGNISENILNGNIYNLIKND